MLYSTPRFTLGLQRAEHNFRTRFDRFDGQLSYVHHRRERGFKAQGAGFRHQAQDSCLHANKPSERLIKAHQTQRKSLDAL